MIPEDLPRYMRLIAKEIVQFDGIAECEVKKNEKTNKSFIHVITSKDNHYGISYLFKTNTFEIWSHYGEFKIQEEQLHISFDSVYQLLSWLDHNNLDSIALQLTLIPKDTKDYSEEEDEYYVE